MPKLSHRFAFVALAFWLLSSWAGAHGHFCFDGQEPPVSVHMSMLSGHLEHHADEAHQDADVDLAQSVLAKLTKIDLGLILFAVLSLLLPSQPLRIFSSCYIYLLPPELPHARPPLRAPPVIA